MRFDVVTLFPDLFGPHLSQGITRRAFESKQVDVRLWQLRDFADDNYRRVDDRPYGGGPGMVMLAEPLLRAVAAIKADRAATTGDPVAAAPVPVVNFTPTGQPLTQALVRGFASGPGAVLLCGRYEGIDQRFLDAHATHHISLGDFVLSGGELPALALLDAVARLQDGVLAAPSHLQDSFSDGAYGLLEGPSYSRPETLVVGGAAQPVPPVLLSGHHGDIARYKRESSLLLTARNRPDLLLAARTAGHLSPADERFLRQSGL
jgi:tRNA (guanine37-N1)-methyltransferase